MAKRIHVQAFRDAVLRGFCKRALKGHPKRREGEIVCVLPGRVVGPRVMRNAMTYLAHRHLEKAIRAIREEHHEADSRLGRDSDPDEKVRGRSSGERPWRT